MTTFARRLVALTIATLFCAATTRAGASDLFVLPKMKPDAPTLLLQGPAGDTFEFIRTCATTGNRYTLAYSEVPPGAGPSPHVHAWADEWFYTPEGGITIQMGERIYPSIHSVPGKTAPKDVLHEIDTVPGGLYYGSRGMIHAFVNKGKKTYPVYSIWAPDDGATAYFIAIGKRIAAVSPNAKPNPEGLLNNIKVAPRFGINYSAERMQYITSIATMPNAHGDDNEAARLRILLGGGGPAPGKLHIACPIGRK
jgi:mannose-6-phosphate isomerase-like protein (cupin superfamily)